jgi:hypothetical protein
MPPRYSYWTIIAGGLPTAFRAAEREDLLPTFTRLREKQPDAEMKWFARGRLWDSPADARAAFDAQRNQGFGAHRDRLRRDGAQARGDGRPGDQRDRPAEGRGRGWRPGGEHRDPRQKFKDAKKARNQRWREEKFERKQERPRDRFDARGGPRAGTDGRGADRRPHEANRNAAPKPAWSGERRREGKPDRGPRQPDRGPRQPDRGPRQPDWRARPQGPAPAKRDWSERREGSAPPAQKRPSGERRQGGRPFERRSFERNQGTEEPQPPPRPRGPNREPRPGETPAPTPPPRPSEPSTPPPTPERGRGRKLAHGTSRWRERGGKGRK